jgi:hypothetical protein
MNDVFRFALELVGIVAAGWWGFHASDHPILRWVLGIAVPLALILVWAFVVAPKADNPIDPIVRMLIGSAVLLIAAMGLYATEQRTPALAFAGLIVLNTLLAFVFAG